MQMQISQVNKPSNANVCYALCHNTAFIFVTYDPQIVPANKLANFLEKQGTLSETKISIFPLENSHPLSTLCDWFGLLPRV